MILIIDFGSQTAHLIGRRLHALGVPAEYTDPEGALSVIKTNPPKGIILSDGTASMYDNGIVTEALHAEVDDKREILFAS